MKSVKGEGREEAGDRRLVRRGQDMPSCSVHGAPDENPAVTARLNDLQDPDQLALKVIFARLHDSPAVARQLVDWLFVAQDENEPVFQAILAQVCSSPQTTAEDLRSLGANWLWDADPHRCRFHRSAVRLFGRAIELDPGFELHWLGRGWAHGHLEQYAAQDFAKAAELQPDNASVWYFAALMQLAAGDSEAYHSTSANVLEQFRDTDDAKEAHCVAWTCMLAPDAVSDMTQPLQLAETAVQRDASNGAYAQAYAIALYRAGRLDEAVPMLQTVADNPAPDTSPAYSGFFLAMTHHRLGHEDEARAWLQKATEQAEEEIQGDASWIRRTNLQLLRSEAEALIIGTEAPNPPTEPATNK